MIGVKKISRKIYADKKGFSLIEMVVAVSLFALVNVVMTNIFQNVIEGQRSAVAAQNIQESMRYTLEVMSKEIRTAKKLASPTECDTTLGMVMASSNSINKVFNQTDGNSILYFKNKNNECVVYYLLDGQLKVIHDAAPYGDLDEENDYQVSSTPDEIIVSNLHFDVVDDNYNTFHSVQPRVTIRMDVENKTLKEIHKQKMSLQTTISSRHYE
jgi:prepilin-type N-terminal cleavage/methylation domain-containing protein